ncbi:MAG: tetratricopeptide repeat protein [Verrucomicrobiales bacterium]|nr:tetratricopeptide repeat protein [Verrucomicrobiales bacterium]
MTATLTGAHAQRELKPGDIFLQGHMLLQEARRHEDALNYELAAAKSREASEMYDSIALKWPTWQTEMLDNRRKKVRRDYARYQDLALDQKNVDDMGLPQRGPGGPGIAVKPRSRPGVIAPLPRAATPRQKYQQLQREVDTLRESRNKLITQSQEQQSHTMASNRALGKERERVAQLETQLANAQVELKRLDGVGVVALKNQVEDLTTQLETATAGLTAANKQNREFLAEFERIENERQQMSLQLEEVTRQRDDMTAIIKGLQTGDSTLALATENSKLREMLNVAQRRVDELELDKLENEAEIASLKEEVSQLKMELVLLKNENAEAQQRLVDMQALLDGNAQQSTFNPPSVQDEAVRQENEVLREIIDRQLKQQKFRQEKREIVIAELEALEEGSDELIAQIDSITAEAPLTDEQKAVVQRAGAATMVVAQLARLSSEVGNEAVDRKISRYAEAAAFNFEKERFEEAQLHYAEILDFAPRHMETIYNLGVTKLKLNDVKEAQRLFERGALLEPTNDRVHYMLGVCCYYMDAVDDAIMAVRKAHELNPGASDATGFLGLIYYFRGDLEKAVVALQSAVELAPREPRWHYNLCLALGRQASPDLARSFKHYEEAKKLGLQPDDRMEETFRKRGFSPAG